MTPDDTSTLQDKPWWKARQGLGAGGRGALKEGWEEHWSEGRALCPVLALPAQRHPLMLPLVLLFPHLKIK